MKKLLVFALALSTMLCLAADSTTIYRTAIQPGDNFLLSIDSAKLNPKDADEVADILEERLETHSQFFKAGELQFLKKLFDAFDDMGDATKGLLKKVQMTSSIHKANLPATPAATDAPKAKFPSVLLLAETNTAMPAQLLGMTIQEALHEIQGLKFSAVKRQNLPVFLIGSKKFKEPLAFVSLQNAPFIAIGSQKKVFKLIDDLAAGQTPATASALELLEKDADLEFPVTIAMTVGEEAHAMLDTALTNYGFKGSEIDNAIRPMNGMLFQIKEQQDDVFACKIGLAFPEENAAITAKTVILDEMFLGLGQFALMQLNNGQPSPMMESASTDCKGRVASLNLTITEEDKYVLKGLFSKMASMAAQKAPVAPAAP